MMSWPCGSPCSSSRLRLVEQIRGSTVKPFIRWAREDITSLAFSWPHRLPAAPDVANGVVGQHHDEVVDVLALLDRGAGTTSRPPRRSRRWRRRACRGTCRKPKRICACVSMRGRIARKWACSASGVGLGQETFVHRLVRVGHGHGRLPEETIPLRGGRSCNKTAPAPREGLGNSERDDPNKRRGPVSNPVMGRSRGFKSFSGPSPKVTVPSQIL